MNAWLKRCVFNLDLNRVCLNSEPRTLSGRLFQSLGAKYEQVISMYCSLLFLWTAIHKLGLPY